jgi:cell division septal protein FtsQ
MTATARMDPRLRARRVAVVRQQGRRRLRILLAGVSGLAVAAGAWLAAQSPLLDVETIAVQGGGGVSEREARAASGVDVGDALLLIDLGDVESRLEAIPQVDQAHVRRDLPDGLRISFVERAPAAWARRDASSVAIVDPTGRVLADAADAPAGLPELVGLIRIPPPGGTVGPTGAARVVDELPAPLASRTAVVLALGGEVTLRLDDGVEVRLGRPGDVGAKARTALAVLAARPATPITYVDVRVPAAPVTG